MSVDRVERVNSLMLREISSDLYHVLASEREIDLAAITVTRVEVAPNLRSATVWLSITNTEHRHAWLRRIAHHAKNFQDLINRNMVLKYTPRLRFTLDEAVEKGDRVLDLLSHLDIPEEPEA